MPSARRAFVIMPYGPKTGPDGVPIDFDAVYEKLLVPAIQSAGLTPFRADADRRGGSIHLDMFQSLLLSEFVVADLTLDNPNVWYEIGVRHALRAGGTVLTYALRDRLPFDIAGQRMERYTLEDGRLKSDPRKLKCEQERLTEAIVATLAAGRGRPSSPVYQQLRNLVEPDWKQLKVGDDMNQHWQELDAWQSRVDIARRQQRPGDILLLADETPNSILEFEALRIAAEALLSLNRPTYALEILERARRLDPDNLVARRLEGAALGRMCRYAEAKELLRRLSEQSEDGETLGLLAQTWKDEWAQLWEAHSLRKRDPLAAARNTATTLQKAVEAYMHAFRAAPTEYHLGINALTLGRLWEHVTGLESRLPLDSISAGVVWCVSIFMGKANYRALVTRAELALIENRKDEALRGYSEAAAVALAGGDRFALQATSQQLDLLGTLKFRTDIIKDAAKVIELAERQLDARIGINASEVEPKHVIVFSGHMIDDPAIRGPGKSKPERFPPRIAQRVAHQIIVALDRLDATAGDLALCGGACGADLLFALLCLDRGMRVELYLARKEAEFLRACVTFADPDHQWEKAFMRVKANPRAQIWIMPEEIGVGPEEISIQDRCNRWMLFSGLSHGAGTTAFLAVWDGKGEDGPGGTDSMIELIRQMTGRQPELIHLHQL